jgi:hypothetical protein
MGYVLNKEPGLCAECLLSAVADSVRLARMILKRVVGCSNKLIRCVAATFVDQTSNGLKDTSAPVIPSLNSPSYNIALASFQPVIRLDRDTGEREIAMMRWGLVPHFAKSLADLKGWQTSTRKPKR